MEHKYLTCNCGSNACNVCNGLLTCEICGGSEGELLPQCPGRRLTAEEHEYNYHHREIVRIDPSVIREGDLD